MENEKLLIDAVTIIANKLGTTGAHLWEVLVTQAPISCAINLTIFIISFLLATLGWTAGAKLLAKADKVNNCELRETLSYAGIGIMFLAFIVSLFIVFNLFNVTLWISGFFNPEYWALKQVISMMNP